MLYILTYNHPHRKTQDLLLKLRAKGYNKVTVLSTPWEDRKNFIPLVPHRFLDPEPIYPNQLCERLGYSYIEMESYSDVPQLNQNDWVLIGGAGIIPENLTKTKKIINSHPAYLPYVRGLDALKWAIYEGLPIGVTTHIISKEVDLGFCIKKQLLPLHSWDSFHSVAWRQYELEISMLADSIEDLTNNPQTPMSETEDIILPKPKRRMPHRQEMQMLKKFNNMILTVND